MTPNQPLPQACLRLAASRNPPIADRAALRDHSPARTTFLRDVLDGLRTTPKTLPCKYLYDERGSALFDEICTLPEYYLTRTEIAIMRRYAPNIAELIGERALVFELGSGSGIKTRLLLDHLESPAAYVPIDISREHLLRSARELAARHPHIPIIPLCADYTRPFTIPEPTSATASRVAYFPGSTIGNLHRNEARQLLSRLAQLAQTPTHQTPGLTTDFRGARKTRVGRAETNEPAQLLIGFDLIKDRATLEAAYNDSRGVTAEFNFNLLRRINRELGADIDARAFDFRATWNETAGRVESHLISRVDQSIDIAGETIALPRGERIRTECSYKYTIPGFAELAAPAGWGMKRWWTDERRRFAVALMACSSAAC